MEVTVGKGASLTGAISLTETRHVDETGKQNTHFTINEYYYLGHVADRNYRNGHAKATVTLKDGGVWKVTGESLISKLEVSGGTIQGANGGPVVMKIGGKETPIQPGQTYSGDIVIAPVTQLPPGRVLTQRVGDAVGHVERIGSGAAGWSAARLLVLDVDLFP